MAIVVEEEKSFQVGIINILMWIVILGIIGSAAYYIFFKRPDTIPLFSTPANLRNVQEFAKRRIPEEVVSSGSFLALKQYVVAGSLVSPGRTNPFLPFENASPAKLPKR